LGAWRETEGNRSYRFWFGLFQVYLLPLVESGHGLLEPWVNRWGAGGAGSLCCNLPIPTCTTTSSSRLRLLQSSGQWDQALTWQGREDVQAGNAAVQPPDEHGLLPQPANTWLQGLLLPKTLTGTAVFLSLGEKCVFNALFPNVLHNNL